VSYEERHIWWIGYSERGVQRQVSGPQNAGHTNPPDPGQLELYPVTNIDTSIAHQSPVQADIAVTALHHLIYNSGIRPENQSAWGLEGRSWLCEMGLCNDKLTGIEDQSSAKEVALYPNPANNRIFIKATAPAQIEIYNAIGEMLQTVKYDTQAVEINVSSFSTGVYFAKIQFADGSNSIKQFVKE
jgi:hypothetical protein